MKRAQPRDVLLALGGYYAATGIAPFLSRRRHTPEIVGMAGACAVGLAAVDVVYVAKRRISPVYLVDALVRSVVAGGLAAAPARRGRAPGSAGGVG